MKSDSQAHTTHDSVRPIGNVLTVGVDQSPPPPLCFGLPESDDFKGFEVDLLRAIGSRLGRTLHFRSALWSVALTELQDGRFDMICSAATITPRRRQLLEFSDSYFDTDLALIVRRDSSIHCVDDLARRTIGVRVATVAEEFVRGRCQRSEVRTFDLNVDAYQSLCDRQLDAVVDDRPIGAYFARSLDGLKVAPPLPGTGFQYGMVFAKNNDRLREAVNQVLAELRTDGTWERLYRQWFQEGDAQ